EVVIIVGHLGFGDHGRLPVLCWLKLAELPDRRREPPHRIVVFPVNGGGSRGALGDRSGRGERRRRSRGNGLEYQNDGCDRRQPHHGSSRDLAIPLMVRFAKWLVS